MPAPTEPPGSRAVRLLLAPFEMKGTLSAAEVASIMEEILSVRGFATRRLPLGDGGPGTLDAVFAAVPEIELRTVSVEDALGRKVTARFGLLSGSATVPTRAYLEAAEAHGLWRLQRAELQALHTTSSGVGQLIAAAMDAGATELCLGLGGSASNDGGAGALEALGAQLLDGRGRPLPSGGAALNGLARVDLTGLDSRLAHTRLTLACDVTAPLLGPTGASRLFAPQKGASPDDVERLEAGLARFAAQLEDAAGDVSRDRPGAGAAGGLGFGLMAALKAQARPGLEVVAELVGLDAALRWADRVLTAEGRLDAQSLLGKGPVRLARRAAGQGMPTVAFVGTAEVSAPEFEQVVLATAEDLTDPDSARRALERALAAWRA